MRINQKFFFIFTSLLLNLLGWLMASLIIRQPENAMNWIVFIVHGILSINVAHLLLKLIRFDFNKETNGHKTM